MGILQSGIETYEAHREWVAKDIAGQFQPLCPIGHMVVNAKVTIYLSKTGEFRNMEMLSGSTGKIRTIVPATEDSASRTGRVIAPHPLCDKLDYLSSKDEKKYLAYIELLHQWLAYDDNQFLGSIEKYIQGKTIWDDIRNGIESDNSWKRKKKTGLKESAKKLSDPVKTDWLVRWVVAGEPCWKGETGKRLMDSWLSFYQKAYVRKNGTKYGFCMITGEKGALTEKTDKGIIRAVNGAKLISSNDDKNFKFNGRFQLADQACTVGYEASQKAHRGLSWVSHNQGVVIGRAKEKGDFARTFVCWNPSGKEVANPQKWLKTVEKGVNNITPLQYKEDLAHALEGYRLNRPDRVIVAAMDASCKGRASLAFYSEMPGKEFYDRLGCWYESCQWPNGKRSPQPFTFLQFAKFAYGTEREKGNLETKAASAKKVVQRLTECMIYGARVPSEIVMALVKNASEPQRYKNKSNQYRILRAACMLLRKQLNDRAEREEWTLALDPTKMDRSYQFGRLLALYELVERKAHQKKKVKNRTTNATKYRSMYRMRPMETALRLEDKLIPYFQQITQRDGDILKKQIAQVVNMLSIYDQEELNRPLSAVYLMGYYLQWYASLEEEIEEEPNQEAEEWEEAVEDNEEDEENEEDEDEE